MIPENVANKRKIGLDYVRTAAILLVIAGHYFAFLKPLGIYGVELFFVLSGYLIGGILYKTVQREETFRFPAMKNFLIRRWFRTLPNYYLFLVINFLCIAIFSDFYSFSSELLLFPFFLQNLAWERSMFFSESWSLAVEEWFYLLLPATLLALNKFLPRSQIRNALLYATVLFLTLPLVSRFFFSEVDAETRMIVLLRLDSIMYGVLAIILKNQFYSIWSQIRKFGLLWLALSIIVMALQFPDLAAGRAVHLIYLSLTPLCFACILPMFDELKFEGFAVPNAITNRIALWSYSMYLLHLPVFFVFGNLLQGEFESTSGKFIFRAFCVGMTIFLSYLIFTYFEKPITDLRNRFSKSE